MKCTIFSTAVLGVWHGPTSRNRGAMLVSPCCMPPPPPLKSLIDWFVSDNVCGLVTQHVWASSVLSLQLSTGDLSVLRLLHARLRWLSFFRRVSVFARLVPRRTVSHRRRSTGPPRWRVPRPRLIVAGRKLRADAAMGRCSAPLRHQPATIDRSGTTTENGLPLRRGCIRVGRRTAGLVRVSAETDHGDVGCGCQRTCGACFIRAGSNATSTGVARSETVKCTFRTSPHRGRCTSGRFGLPAGADPWSPARRQWTTAVAAAADESSELDVWCAGCRRKEHLDRVGQRSHSAAASKTDPPANHPDRSRRQETGHPDTQSCSVRGRRQGLLRLLAGS